MFRIALIVILLLSHEPAYAGWVAPEKRDQPVAKQTVYVNLLGRSVGDRMTVIPTDHFPLRYTS